MRPLVSLLALLVLAPTAAAQPAEVPALLVATVVDAEGTPVPGATVRVVGGAATAADGEGVARLRVAVGPSVVSVGAVGFRPATFTVVGVAGQTLEGDVVLEPSVEALGEVVTVAERLRADLDRAGFYDRREDGRGAFIDFEEMQERSIHSVRDALRGMSGVQIQRWDGAEVPISTRAVSGADGFLQNAKPCPLAVYLNGSKVTGTVVDGATEYVDIAQIQTSDLAGVEVYVGAARTPPQYGQFNPCGVVLLWSRTQ